MRKAQSKQDHRVIEILLTESMVFWGEVGAAQACNPGPPILPGRPCFVTSAAGRLQISACHAARRRVLSPILWIPWRESRPRKRPPSPNTVPALQTPSIGSNWKPEDLHILRKDVNHKRPLNSSQLQARTLRPHAAWCPQPAV